MQEFPPNSRRAEEPPPEPKRLEQVTSAEAVRRKKGLGRQFKDTFIGGDARSAAEYVFFSVLVPSAKDMLFEVVQSGFEKLIFGDTRPRRHGPVGGYSPTGHVAYHRMGTSAPPNQARTPLQTPRMISRTSRARHDFDDIVVPTRQEAEEVLDRMYDILSRHGSVNVAELYELTGIQSSHTDFKWGWTELRGSRAARLRSGDYLLDLPDPQPLG